jgi:8-oxo-dGTP pyrophosphatase MutT (NUDIX family)
MSQLLDLETIRQRLARSEPTRRTLPHLDRWSAVAVVLRQNGAETEVLLIQRAVREGDPWSGQMAFPGGHTEPQDEDRFATVRRETLEEVGFDLNACCKLIGRLDDVQATARGSPTGMGLAPFVFELKVEPEIRLSDEVAEALWAPLGGMAGGRLDAIKEYWVEGTRLEFPAYDVDGHIVWGLTFRMLQDLFARLGVARAPKI